MRIHSVNAARLVSVWSVVVSFCDFTGPILAASPEEARQTLAAAKLVNLGDAWLCREEVDVRRWLDALEPIERQHQALQAIVDERVRKNEAAGRELASKRQEVASLAKKLAASGPADLGPSRQELQKAHDELSDKIKQLRRKYRRPPQFAAHDATRADVVRLANARAGLTLAAAAFRRQLAAMPKRYEELAAQSELLAALAELGPQHRLGTGRDYMPEAANRLARLDRIIQSATVPVYFDDDHVRLVAVVNDATPLTVSLRGSNGPTHLPHSMATSLGLDLENAASVEYAAAGNRRLKCRQVTLASVQVGNVVLRDVKALILPPEGEDLGAKLGKAAYKDHYFDVELGKLRMTILSSAPAATTKAADVGPSKMSRPAGSPARHRYNRSVPSAATRRTHR